MSFKEGDLEISRTAEQIRLIRDRASAIRESLPKPIRPDDVKATTFMYWAIANPERYQISGVAGGEAVVGLTAYLASRIWLPRQGSTSKAHVNLKIELDRKYTDPHSGLVNELLDVAGLFLHPKIGPYYHPISWHNLAADYVRSRLYRDHAERVNIIIPQDLEGLIEAAGPSPETEVADRVALDQFLRHLRTLVTEAEWRIILARLNEGAEPLPLEKIAEQYGRAASTIRNQSATLAKRGHNILEHLGIPLKKSP